MNTSIYIDAFAALLPNGIYSSKGHLPWRPDQHGPQDVQREQVLDKPYPGFGKLQIADRLAFSAASLLLSSYENRSGDSCGITIGIPFGSLSTDLRYMESVTDGFPSPALFSATLPSSPVSDIAIYYKFKGPNRVICNNASSGLCAFTHAVTMIRMQKAATVLALSVNAIDPADYKSPLAGKTLPKENSAFAFLLTSIKSSMGLNCRLDVSLGVPDKNFPAMAGEIYFENLVNMLSNHQTGSIPVETEGYSGFFSIDKD